MADEPANTLSNLLRRNMMYHVSRHFAAAAVIGLCMIPATAARAEDQDRNDKANRYVITNLDSDLKGEAAVQDTVLQNSWGVAFSPAGSPFWINDNATGCSTLYDGEVRSCLCRSIFRCRATWCPLAIVKLSTR